MSSQLARLARVRVTLHPNQNPAAVQPHPFQLEFQFAEDAVELEPEIVVQARRGVFLHDEARAPRFADPCAAPRLHRPGKVALCPVASLSCTRRSSGNAPRRLRTVRFPDAPRLLSRDAFRLSPFRLRLSASMRSTTLPRSGGCSGASIVLPPGL